MYVLKKWDTLNGFDTIQYCFIDIVTGQSFKLFTMQHYTVITTIFQSQPYQIISIDYSHSLKKQLYMTYRTCLLFHLMDVEVGCHEARCLRELVSSRFAPCCTIGQVHSNLFDICHWSRVIPYKGKGGPSKSICQIG